MMLYKRVKLEENVPIQFLAVYATNWPFGSGVQPTAGFVEAEDADALRRQVEELSALLQEFEWVEIDPDPRPCYGMCFYCGAMTKDYENGQWVGTHEADCKLHAALAREEVTE